MNGGAPMNEMMKALYVTKTFDEESQTPGQITCLQVARPCITAPDDVLIHVAYASICGSDAHYIKDNLLTHLFPPVPFAVGHELSGTIEDLGPAAEAKGLRRGDHVTGDFVLECGHCAACRSGQRQFCERPHVVGGAQAEYIVWKADQVFKLPDEVPLMDAALLEPFTIAVGAMDLAELKIGQSVFALGAGGVGQMLIQLASKSGASQIGASVRTPSKREMALTMGADFTVDPVHESLEESVAAHTGGRGFDVVFETSGSLECANQALQIVKPGGTIVFLSYYAPGSVLTLPLFETLVSRGLTLRGVQLAQNSWIRALEMFPKMNLRPLISKVYSLDECDQAYEDLISGQYLKILFNCSEMPQ